jgi:hypothetical protein
MSKARDVIIDRSRLILNGAAAIVEMTNDWQTIREFLCNRLEEDLLTDMQKKKLERYQFMYSNTMKGKYTKQEVISMCRRFFSISQSQAYEDYNCMSEIFATVMHINKQFEIKMQIESVKMAMAKATEICDFKGAEAARKNLISLIALLPEEESSPGELFQGHIVEASYDPRRLGAPAVDWKAIANAINDKRKVKIDFSKFEDAEVINGDS